MIELERKLEQLRKESAAKSDELRHLRTREKEVKKLIKSINRILGKTTSGSESPRQQFEGRNEGRIS